MTLLFTVTQAHRCTAVSSMSSSNARSRSENVCRGAWVNLINVLKTLQWTNLCNYERVLKQLCIFFPYCGQYLQQICRVTPTSLVK